MNCPLCSADSKVFNSRPIEGAVWRRRECLKCRHRWTTYEITERRIKRVERVEAIVAELQEG